MSCDCFYRVFCRRNRKTRKLPPHPLRQKKRMTGMNGLSVNLGGIGNGAGYWKNSMNCCICCRHSSTNIKKSIDRFCCIAGIMDISTDAVFSK